MQNICGGGRNGSKVQIEQPMCSRRRCINLRTMAAELWSWWQLLMNKVCKQLVAMVLVVALFAILFQEDLQESDEPNSSSKALNLNMHFAAALKSKMSRPKTMRWK